MKKDLSGRLAKFYAPAGERERIQERFEQAVMRRLPKCSHDVAIAYGTSAISWLSMQPSSKDATARYRNTLFGFTRRLGSLMAITAGSAALWATLPWYVAAPLALPLTLMQIGILRHFAIGEAHMAGHHAANGDVGAAVSEEMLPRWWRKSDPKRLERANRWVGRWATAAGLLTPHWLYALKHWKHHALKSFSIAKDPDAIDLKEKVGLLPGETKEEVQRRSYWTHLTSLFIHGEWFAQRLKANLLEADPTHRRAAMVILALLLAPLFFVPALAWIMAIAVPWTVGVQIAAQLQLPTLHVWMASNEPVKSNEESAERMQGRFPFTPLPKETFSLASPAWWKWMATIAFVDLPFRIAVLNRQLSSHDAHHLGYYIGVRDEHWDDLPYWRHVMKQEGDHFAIGQRELWGTVNIFKMAWASMAASVQEEEKMKKKEPKDSAETKAK